MIPGVIRFGRGWVLASLFFSLGCAGLLTEPEGKEAIMAIGGCEFQWVRTGGSKKDFLEVLLEEVVSGRVYNANTNSEGYYFFPNLRPGVYMLRKIRVKLTDVAVEHEPDTKIFVMLTSGKAYYLGKLVVEVDKSDLKAGRYYRAYEKYISGDLQVKDIRKLIAKRKGDSEWLKREIVPENALERF